MNRVSTKKFPLSFLSGHPVYLPAADPDTDERGRGGGK